ncbi:MAG: ABC transporter permease, partial [Alphaproteobacteria bacterium]
MTAVAAAGRRGHGALALQLALGVLLLLAIAWPMADLLRRALGDGDLAPSPLAAALGDRFARRVLWNTLLLGAALAVVGTALATAYAYAMTRIDIPWKPLWHFLALLPTISPPILMALALVLLYGRRGIVTSGLLGMKTTALYGFWGLLAAQVISYFPFAYLLMANQFRGLDASAEEAARTLGATSWQVLRTVSLPLLVPGLAASALLLVGYSFADLGNPLLLGGDFPVMSAQIYLAIIGMYDVPQGAALAVLLLLPAALMFAMHKWIGARMTHAAVGARGAG